MNDLRALILSMIEANSLVVREFTVAAVNADDTVTLSLGTGDPILSVPCTSSYPIRAVGDKVLVAQLSSTSWHVLSKANSARSDGAVNLADLYAGLDNLETLILREIPHSITLSMGTGAAPSGFVTATDIAYRDRGNGSFDLYLRVPTAHTASTRDVGQVQPRSLTMVPNNVTTWQGGSFEFGLRQGAGLVAAAFFDLVSAAVAGHTVTKITAIINRNSADVGDVPLVIGLHNSISDKPTMSLGPATTIPISPAQSLEWQLPDLWRDALVAGSARGLMFVGTGAAVIDSVSLRIEFAPE